jgi:hypothetical protein
MNRPSPARRLLTAAVSIVLVTLTVVPGPASASASASTSEGGSTPATGAVLTNLAHLDDLTTRVRPPAQSGHTTYRLGEDPSVAELWVYANHEDDGTYERTGGGTYDPTTNTYGQGAYDADDVARAAIVYLRHWRQFHDRASRNEAFGLLRGLTYLQTVTGPNAGNVVLWMQPDGTLNPSPTPVELPDPSDSGASYWLARTIWALGEGYAAFQHVDPSFARFLRTRMGLALSALRDEALVHFGQHYVINGVRTPAWLVVDGADASAEAVLGLSAFVDAEKGDSAQARPARAALAQLARGIAELGAGGIRQWPYGALLPSARSLSEWHAWGAQMPSALAVAATTLHDPSLLRPAIRDAAQFTPALLAATGPVNALSPAPVDGSQIAYGADARVQGLIRVGRAADAPGISRLAGIAAGWYFGQNPSGEPMYNPATGVTYDGVSADGIVNLNSGAESTIHGLLSMLALDADPALAALARSSAHVVARDGQLVVEAESATLSGSAQVVTADPPDTGVAKWSAGAYVEVRGGSTLTWNLAAAASPAGTKRLIEPIVDRGSGAAGRTVFSADGRPLGSVSYGGAGVQGQSAWPSTLVPVTLGQAAPAAPTTLTARTYGGAGRLDALLITPLVSALRLRGNGRTVVLLTSRSNRRQVQTTAIGGRGPSQVDGYDRFGHLTSRSVVRGAVVRVGVPAGGFAIVTQ